MCASVHDLTAVPGWAVDHRPYPGGGEFGSPHLQSGHGDRRRRAGLAPSAWRGTGRASRGNFYAHLCRVSERLAALDCAGEVQAAGLTHAAYGTDGFDFALLDRARSRGAAGSRRHRGRGDRLSVRGLRP
ncbi:DUF6817 domain-containing protein [Micromonospora matsumotoense]|uniref:DUF6817 domain-containing protein n=1 Tax=Micromonospora matsumotoense TaxID=121616 RepID=UPI003443E1AB